QSSMEALASRCPVCGAPLPARAACCDYCGTALATIRCAGCFTLNDAAALHCSGCGRELGLEPLPADVALACPEWRLRSPGFGASSGRLCECERCGGQFVEHALLHELLERREVHRGVTRAPTAKQNPLGKTVRYVPCPACGTLMNRNNFGGTS